MNYLLNYRKLVGNLLPPVLRKNKMSAWIRVFSTVFSNHNSRQGLDGFHRIDRLSSDTEKALTKINAIFLAPVSLEDRKILLTDALSVDGTEGINESLIDDLLEIGLQIGQLGDFRRLIDPYGIDETIVIAMETRLAAVELRDVFSSFAANLPESDLVFDYATYVQDLQTLSFERFRREQLYSVYLTGQTIVLETHLNTIYGLTHLEETQRLRIENVGENIHTFFHAEELIYESKDRPEGSPADTSKIDELESLILFDENEEVDTDPLERVLSGLLLSGVIAGDVSRGFPQAIEVYAAKEVDLEDYSIRFVNAKRILNGAGEITGYEDGFLRLPNITLAADSYYYIISDVHTLSDGTTKIDEDVFDAYFDFTLASSGTKTDQFDLDESRALELYTGINPSNPEIGTVLVDKVGEADEVGTESLWDYTGSWYYREGIEAHADVLTNPLQDLIFFYNDWRYGGTSPFVSQDIINTVSWEDQTNLITDAGTLNKAAALRPFLEKSFDLGNIENEADLQFIGFKTESNQGAGFNFKIICPDFKPENRPFENTPEGVREFLNNLVTEVNKFRLAGKFFIVEAEGNKLLGSDIGRIFDENFTTEFQ